MQEEVATRGTVLAMPSLTLGKLQMLTKDVDESWKIFRVCIHFERVIFQLKTFKILNPTVLISQADLLNDVNITVSVNLNKSLVSKWTTTRAIIFIIFTVAFVNIFLSRSHSVAKDEWFLY